MRKLAIFGGAFNPIHWGHLVIAEAARTQMGLEQVLWVPSQRSPHKPEALLSYAHRCQMIQLAIADHPAFTLSEIEATRVGNSYAIDTLQDLQAHHADAHWFWIIGADAFQTLPRWRGYPELLRQCHWLIAPRSLESAPALRLPPLPQGCDWLAMPGIALSSSLIREYCIAGQSIRYLVPEPVRAYIQAQHLYQPPATLRSLAADS